jgi:hypothetical protein
MRYFTMAAAGLCLLAMNANAGASQASAAGIEVRAPLQLAQAEPAKKNETVTQKVKREGRNLKQRAKRAWRDLTELCRNLGDEVIRRRGLTTLQ